MRRLLLGGLAVFAVGFALSISAMPAVADSIDFNFQNGSLSYTPTGVVTGTVTATTLGSGPELQVARNGVTNLGPYDILGTLNFMTGGFVSGNGSAGTPFDWGSGGNISVTAGSTAMVDGSSLAGQTLFTGTFTGSETAVVNGTDATFTADFVGGTVDSALAAALGFPADSTSVSGVMTENFVLTNAPGTPITASLSSGDLTVSPTIPTPEPGTLALLAFGLLGMAVMARRKPINE